MEHKPYKEERTEQGPGQQVQHTVRRGTATQREQEETFQVGKRQEKEVKEKEEGEQEDGEGEVCDLAEDSVHGLDGAVGGGEEVGGQEEWHQQEREHVEWRERKYQQTVLGVESHGRACRDKGSIVVSIDLVTDAHVHVVEHGHYHVEQEHGSDDHEGEYEEEGAPPGGAGIIEQGSVIEISHCGVE